MGCFFFLEKRKKKKIVTLRIGCKLTSIIVEPSIISTIAGGFDWTEGLACKTTRPRFVGETKWVHLNDPRNL